MPKSSEMTREKKRPTEGIWAVVHHDQTSALKFQLRPGEEEKRGKPARSTGSNGAGPMEGQGPYREPWLESKVRSDYLGARG